MYYCRMSDQTYCKFSNVSYCDNFDDQIDFGHLCDQELDDVLERIFKFFLYQYSCCGECNLLNSTIRDEFDFIKFIVQDLFEDLWKGTNYITGYALLRTTSRSESDIIRLAAKDVFDKMWTYHNKHCLSGNGLCDCYLERE